jgi:hypothetical protein
VVCRTGSIFSLEPFPYTLTVHLTLNRFVETPGFIQFMDLVCKKWNPFGRNRLDTILDEMFLDVNDKIRAELASANYVSITIDLWSDRRGSI